MRKINNRIFAATTALIVMGSLASCAASGSAEEETSAPTNEDVTMTTEDTASISLQGDTASCDLSSVEIDGGIVSVTAAGTYTVSGTLTDGQIVVDAGDDDEIRLILAGCDITNSDSAAIYVKNADMVYITLEENSTNTLANSGSFNPDGDTNVDGVIFSKDDLTIDGEGTLIISSSPEHGIVCKDELVIDSGEYEITTTGDGIQAKESIVINDGTVSIEAEEAIESTYIEINGGIINISASDDGINASQKSDSYTPTIEINGGEITIDMAQGDTDAIDSNGDLMITGGTITITAQSAFDYDGTCEYVGGTIIVNGEEIVTITNQFEGGMDPGGMQPPEGFDGSDGEMTPPEGNNGFGGDGMLPPGGDGTPPSGDPPPER